VHQAANSVAATSEAAKDSIVNVAEQGKAVASSNEISGNQSLESFQAEYAVPIESQFKGDIDMEM
jgi:hypothetical protein